MRVALIGMGNLVRERVPWDDLDVQIWGMASRPRLLAKYRRLDLAFEVHDQSIWPGVRIKGRQHVEAMSRLGCPIVTQEHIPGVAVQTEFPLQSAIDVGADLFVSSFDYMMAYAILQGATWVGCYGFPMAEDDFKHQRVGAHFWIGLAKGLGIKTHIPDSSTLLSTPYRYGGKNDPRCGAPRPAEPVRRRASAFTLEAPQGV